MNRLAFVFAICGALLWGLAFPIAQQLPGNFPPGVFSNTAALSGGGFTPSCTASTNWLARATNVTLTTDKSNYDNLLCGLNTDGVLAKLDALYIFAAVDAATYKLNLINSSFSLTETATVTATQYTGIAGDGVSGREDTGFTANTSGTNYLLNSASYGYCILTSSALTNGIQMGTASAFLSSARNDVGGGGILQYSINGSGDVPVVTNQQGFWIINRSAVSAVQAYRNGSSIGSALSASVGLDNTTITIMVEHDGGASFNQFSTLQFAAAFLAGSLTATDAGNFHTRLNTYLTAYGQGGKC